MIYKPFDLSSKSLVEADPVAWLRLLGLPGERAELFDANLSTHLAEADRLLCVYDPDYLINIEFQSSYDPRLSERLLMYNVLAHYKYEVPVISVVVLLRPEADGTQLTGSVRYGSLSFNYEIFRVWEKTSAELLASPLALVPLAPLASDVNDENLREVVRGMEQRIFEEVPKGDQEMLWTAAYLLMGLRYDQQYVRSMMQEILEMLDLRDSSTYRWILEEGRANGVKQGRQEGRQLGIEEGRQMGLELGLQEGRQEGRQEGTIEGERALLLKLGTKKFGAPDPPTREIVENTQSAERLEELSLRLLEVNTWQELFG